MKNTITEPKNFFDWSKEAYYPSVPSRSQIKLIVNISDLDLRLAIEHPSVNGIPVDVFNGDAISVTLDHSVCAISTYNNIVEKLDEIDELSLMIIYSITHQESYDASSELTKLLIDCQEFHEGEYSLHDFYEHFNGSDHDNKIKDIKERFFVTDLDYVPEARCFFNNEDDYMAWITSDDAAYIESLDDEAQELMNLCDDVNDQQTYAEIENGGKESIPLDKLTRQYIIKYNNL